MENLIKIKNYIIDNKLYLLIMLIGFFSLFLQMNSVVLYADDFGLEHLHFDNKLDIFNNYYQYYMTWGGGFHVLICFIIQIFDIIVWKILNCILILSIISMAVNIITFNNKKYKSVIAIIMWLLIFLLNICISRESIYWLNGSMVYVLSGFQVFILFYFLYSKLILNTSFKKIDYIFLPLISFLGGWSNAQSGILSVIIFFIILFFVKFIKKQPIKPIYMLSFILTIYGFLIFYFAPGNSVRINTFGDFAVLNILGKILYRVDSIYGLFFDFKTYPFTGIPFYFLLSTRINGRCFFQIIK